MAIWELELKNYRIGQIVPSSNTTMETEIPAMFRAREAVAPERFTFHSSRMRMKKVTQEELAAMDAESLRCAAELADARVDVMGYACLVAIMCMGKGYHCTSEGRLHEVTVREGSPTPIVTSAGALVDGLRTLKARKIAMVAPYMKPLTRLVAEYIEAEGIEVVDAIALEIPDNLEVGRRDPMALVEHLQGPEARRRRCAGALVVRPDAVARCNPRGRERMRPAGRVGGDLHHLPDAPEVEPVDVGPGDGAPAVGSLLI